MTHLTKKWFILAVAAVLLVFLLLLVNAVTTSRTSTRSRASEGAQDCCMVQKGAQLEYYKSPSRIPLSSSDLYACTIKYGLSCDINQDGTASVQNEESTTSATITVDDPTYSCLVCRESAFSYASYQFSHIDIARCIPTDDNTITTVSCPIGYVHPTPTITPSPTPTLTPLCQTCDINSDGKYNESDKTNMLLCFPEYSHCADVDVVEDGDINQLDFDAARQCQAFPTKYKTCSKINFNKFGPIDEKEYNFYTRCIAPSKNPCILRDPNKDSWFDAKDIVYCSQNCISQPIPTYTPYPTNPLLLPSPTPIALEVATINKNPSPFAGKRVQVRGKIVFRPRRCFAEKCLPMPKSNCQTCREGAQIYLTNPNGVSTSYDLLLITQKTRGFDSLLCPLKEDAHYDCGYLKEGQIYVLEGVLNHSGSVSGFGSDYLSNGEIMPPSTKFTSLGIDYPCGNYQAIYSGNEFIGCSKPRPQPTRMMFPTRTPRQKRPTLPQATITPDVLSPTQMPTIVVDIYDLNGDGIYNIMDLAIMLKKLGKSDVRYDINNDGRVNALDAILVLKKIKNRSTR